MGVPLVAADGGLVLRVVDVSDRRVIVDGGPFAGRVCAMVRVYGCNLHCRWCDAPSTWDVDGRNGVAFPAEAHMVTVPVVEVADQVLAVLAPLLKVGEAPPLCVVSGGEPLSQSTAVTALVEILARRGVSVVVETNGSRPPLPTAAVDAYVVSPKLRSAAAYPFEVTDPARAERVRWLPLRSWGHRSGVWFNVVVSSPDEVDEAAGMFARLRVDREARWVMPLGVSDGEVRESFEAIVDRATVLGLNVSPRRRVSAAVPV